MVDVPAQIFQKLRFIPAPAGNGKHPPILPYNRPVHPRACGEWKKTTSGAAIGAGSSPRLRGMERGNALVQFVYRFIPAPAGNGYSKSLTCMRLSGSSPRLQGMGSLPVYARLAIRFIPAPAGNGSLRALSAWLSAVHPRACGEWSPDSIHSITHHGSSPRLRGMGARVEMLKDGPRFIPAPAGNGRTTGSQSPLNAVHPRACGEWMKKTMLRYLEPGSSPRLRGMEAESHTEVDHDRFIPAPAGNGRSDSASPRIAAVHPRACGEWPAMMGATRFFAGSSPRLRGMVHDLPQQIRWHRFIPAPAGNGVLARG